MSALIAGGDFDNLDDAILQIQEEEKNIVKALLNSFVSR